MLTQEQQLLVSDKDILSKDGQYDDLAKLSFLTEDILLEQLKQRYEKDLIYVSYFSLTRYRLLLFSYHSDISWRYPRCCQSIS